jgi:SAM-dependent methyltransferase
MMSSHSERVREAFSRQAQGFEDVRFNRVFTEDARWVFEQLECGDDDLLLDVAAGTGHAARSLAGRVRVAVAVDVTPAMLEQGRRAAAKEGVSNVLFQRGDASDLPFLDGSFDVAVTRFALHHMEDPVTVLAEMARCVRAGGRVAVADVVSEEDVELAGAQNRIERLRDSSHTRMLAVSELLACFGELGLEVTGTEAREVDRPLEPWLALTQTGDDAADEVRAAIAAELAGGAPTGLRPYEQDGELRFAQRMATVRGRKLG